MPLMSGFGALEKLPWERINDKIERPGKHGMIVWWKIKAGAHAGAHRHPHEQIVWMLKGKMDFRIGNEQRSMIGGDVAVIPGDIEHEGFFPEDTEVVDVFARRVKLFSRRYAVLYARAVIGSRSRTRRRLVGDHQSPELMLLLPNAATSLEI